MGITVALAFYVEETLEDFTYTDTETRTRFLQIEAEEIGVDSDGLEACNIVDAYVLPEDFAGSALADATRNDCEDEGVYQIVVFMIDTEDEEVDKHFMEQVGVNIMDALDAGDLRLIDSVVVAMYSFEYNNL